ncbi:uncharacterized protein A1O9_09145 [Exophiala aquamarina CBS 119918]|uniref:Uncharacterized protein n=1 Tax=Exophiala aquamarina CBS 119918 TaxID=1182545 RepID=A0A072P602_9EURO|nr:uncharacterized protein A1O9_09145 [Exophiala aquamarina CBS 119918]KEF54703.1 hypothetical protein A1O9_09145 [Exophiala aquamarina CBS 119918]
MDEVLKSRKMSSASARRRKFQERQQLQAMEVERRQQHKRRVMMYDHMAEHVHEQDSGSNDENDEHYDRESSVDTPSERSVLTPDESLSSRAIFGKQHQVDTSSITPLKLHIPEEVEGLEMDLDDNGVKVPPSPSPVRLQASLATLSDFRYDRFSILLESPISDLMSPDLDTDETFSPIETATPIAYQLPKGRPSLISISTSDSTRSKRRTPSTQSPLSQTMSHNLERPSKRLSTTSSHGGFPAAEATLFDVPDLPANAFQLIANASQESLPLSLSQPKTRAERKSSVPRLSTAISHARVSSIKSLVKTPTSATHARSFSRNSGHASRPSTASISGFDGYALKNTASSSSITNLSQMQRPPTSMSMRSVGSNSSHHPMTALPSLPTPPADDVVSDPVAKSMSRKKSFSALRRRSESIGQAIKGLGKITTKHDVPMPTPAMMTPKMPNKSRIDLSSFPTPPLPSPRTGKSNTNSYISPMDRNSSGPIGLGLRSIEGFWQK